MFRERELTTKIEINPGACQKRVAIEANVIDPKAKIKNAKIKIETDCLNVLMLAGCVKELDSNKILARMGDNVVYKAAHMVGLHSTCLTPCAILKAAEAELGLAVKKDAKILFKE